ncbi:SlyX family protein [Microvirga rosea]|uniref:SlyX family protein n=1 Tax=Microvirga rosea TaxID=2715425 RepID=UPI001D0A22AB|nr:SlyX family protein [Microvirga rosea]MCB8821776.1 SlyX family protein [Microvirga rosea]
MSDINDPQARIDALEVRIAHQDRIIEDLNKAVVAQWKQIDSLTRQFANLVDQVREAEERAGTPRGSEPPPPHY